MSISENVAAIRERIERAEKVSPHKKIAIVGVVKFQPLEKILEALSAGISILGVNYAQEGEELQHSLAGKPQWHFIGHLQSRKVRFIPNYSTLQSLDRLELATDLNRKLEEQKRTIEVYVEVNIGEEPQKSGIIPSQVPEFIEKLSAFPHLKVTGLMCLPPPLEPIENRRPHFHRMKKLFDQISKTLPLEHLSMGTSEDYEIAISEGSNMVRLGTCLFGARPAT